MRLQPLPCEDTTGLCSGDELRREEWLTESPDVRYAQKLVKNHIGRLDSGCGAPRRLRGGQAATLGGPAVRKRAVLVPETLERDGTTLPGDST